MPGAVVIGKQKKDAKKPKSRGEIAQSKSKANLDRRTRQNMKNSVTRPKQKQKPKKKSIITKIKDYFDADKTKPGFQFTKPKTAKASEIKIKKKPAKPKNPKQMPKGKDSQIMKAEAARRKRAKDKAAAKKERANRADVRDAKRGGFISANAMKSSAKKANKAQADRKKRKSDELISRGRR